MTSTPAPFFVIGFQRSGTTLLRLMLDSHPEVAIPLDTVGLWQGYSERLAEYGNLATDADVARLVDAIAEEERIRLWGVPIDPAAVRQLVGSRDFPGVIDAFHRAYAIARGKRLWGSKDPGDMKRLHLIDSWFPASRFVHIVRDGRDACLSQLGQDFGHDALLPCALDWREQVWWVRRIGTILGPERYFELRYEDLVTGPEPVLRSVCAFLGLAYAPEMLTYHERVAEAVPDERRHIWPLIDRPPQRANIDRWRTDMSRGERLCFEKRAWDVLREMGYEVSARSPGGAYATEARLMIAGAWRAARDRFRR